MAVNRHCVTAFALVLDPSGGIAGLGAAGKRSISLNASQPISLKGLLGLPGAFEYPEGQGKNSHGHSKQNRSDKVGAHAASTRSTENTDRPVTW